METTNSVLSNLKNKTHQLKNIGTSIALASMLLMTDINPPDAQAGETSDEPIKKLGQTELVHQTKEGKETLQSSPSTQKYLMVEEPEKLTASEIALIKSLNDDLMKYTQNDIDLTRVPVGYKPYGQAHIAEFSKDASAFVGSSVPSRKKYLKLKELDLSVLIVNAPDTSVFNPETKTLNTTKAQEILNSHDEKALIGLFHTFKAIVIGKYTLNVSLEQINSLISVFCDKILATNGGFPAGLKDDAYTALADLINYQELNASNLTKYIKVVEQALDETLSNNRINIAMLDHLTSYLSGYDFDSKKNSWEINKIISKADGQRLANKAIAISDKFFRAKVLAANFLKGHNARSEDGNDGLTFKDGNNISYLPFPFTETADKLIEIGHKYDYGYTNKTSALKNTIGEVAALANRVNGKTTDPSAPVMSEILSVQSPTKKAFLLAVKACAYSPEVYAEIKSALDQDKSLLPLVKVIWYVYGRWNPYQDIFGTAMTMSNTDRTAAQTILLNQTEWTLQDGIFAGCLLQNNMPNLANKIIKKTSNPNIAMTIIRSAVDHPTSLSFKIADIQKLLSFDDVKALIGRISDPTQRDMIVQYSLALFGPESAKDFDENQIKNLFGISLSQFQEIAKQSPHRTRESNGASEKITYFRDLATMRALHQMYPDEDVVWTLFDRYNITRFQKWGTTLLSQQYENRDTPPDPNKKVMLWISDKNDDDGAADAGRDLDEINSNIASIYSTDVPMLTKDNYNWIIIEGFRSKDSQDEKVFVDKLGAVKDHYIELGGKRDAPVIISSGHGGSNFQGPIHVGGYAIQNLRHIVGGGTWAFEACNVGRESNGPNVTQTIAELAGVKSFGSTGEISSGLMTFDAQGNIVHYRVEDPNATATNQPSVNIYDGRYDILQMKDDTLKIEPNETYSVDVLANTGKDAASDFEIKNGDYDGYNVSTGFLEDGITKETALRMYGVGKFVLKKEIKGGKPVLVIEITKLDTANLPDDFNVDLYYTLKSSKGIDRSNVTGSNIETIKQNVAYGQADGKLTLKYEKVDKPIEISELSLNAHSITLGTTETYQLNVNITPSNATNQEVIRESSDPSVATVDQNGLVKASSLGNAEISVKTPDGKLADTCKISVPTSIRETIQTAKINIFPNPVQNELSIKILEDLPDYTGKVEIFNEAGNVLQSKEITGPQVKFNVSNLPIGTYFIRGEIGGKVIKERFVKR